MSAAEPVERVEPLIDGWQLGSTAVSRKSPGELGDVSFIPARVPGTVAGARRDAGLWQMGRGERFDDTEHWFRCGFKADPVLAGERITLRLGGIATLAEVWLNGKRILESDSMFEAHEVDVTVLLGGANELAIVCRPLTAALAQKRRTQPAAKWRTRVVQDQQLRWFRTTLLGRAAGFAPEPEPVGPWRAVSLVRRRVEVKDWCCRLSMSGSEGVVEASCELTGANVAGGTLHLGDRSAEFLLNGTQTQATAKLTIPDVKRWWPHSHGEPVLYPVRAEFRLFDGTSVFFDNAPVGFRSIEAGVEDPAEEGLAVRVNGAPVFCRGVVWTPIDPVALQTDPIQTRRRLKLLREAGVNMVRVVGTAWYEDDVFHRLCDELGILVWQDAMFANMDYPFGDPEFAGKVQGELSRQLRRLSGHASTAVICGNSEIEQQAGMLGLEPYAGRAEFFGEQLKQLAGRELPGVAYLPSAPCGGALPFRTNRGVASYFGVGAYLRPLEDARLAEVRFASECLAFSNVPEPEAIDEMAAATPGGISPTHPAWKRGVPRDTGVGWDFEDVRDHYLREMYGVDPITCRYGSTERYFELSRLVTGDLMAHVFGEWRRAASPCAGGIVLWSNDLLPGAGWGIFDSAGRPKAAYWFLKRALAPVAVWMTGEGLNGVDVHVASDRVPAIDGSAAVLRVALYQHGEKPVGQGSIPVRLDARGKHTFTLEAILGRFADVSYAYRFGLPGHDVAVASLAVGEEIVSQAFFFPPGSRLRAASWGPIERLGLSGKCRVLPGGKLELNLIATRLAWGVRITAKGCALTDQYFCLEPGVGRSVLLTPAALGSSIASISVTASNAEGRIVIPVEVAA